MVYRFGVLVVVLAFAATAAPAQDARNILLASSAAMGADNLKSVQYSGTGWNAAPGQSFGPDDDWPRFEITNYTRVIDFEGRSSREEFTQRQGNYPPQGGGGTPIQGEQRLVNLVSGTFAWAMQGNNANPQPAAAEVRQLDIWLNPHGFVKAALASGNATAFPWVSLGQKMTFVQFTQGKYRVNGMINERNEVERIQTWIANPVFGDMVYETHYQQFKDFNGVKFPTVIHRHQGDPRLNPGHNWMEVRVTAVQPNVAVAALAVPDNVRTATIPPVRVQSQRLAEGVWLIAGGSHNSVLVEFRDYVAVVEAPQNEQRSLAVIAEVEKLVPNKPIQYIVNTHHHFDHSGGLRTYVARGATVVTHERNREFFEDVLLYPAQRTVEPDIFSSRFPWFTGNRIIPFETVTTKYVISDGVRTLELHPVQRLAHNDNMLIAYLPQQKMLINADLYSPPAQGAAAPAVNPSMRSLRENIQRLRLDVAQHVPIHGAPGTHEQFVSIVGASSN